MGAALGGFGPEVMARDRTRAARLWQGRIDGALAEGAARRRGRDRQGMAPAWTWRRYSSAGWLGGRHARPAPRVHERGNKRLDGVLDFVAFAARPMPLLTLLDEAPRRIVGALEAEVCSLYLLEGDKSELVMRGNVGFSNAAIGQVRLRVGEGITGEAVEYMRPISTETAEQHAAYKHFAGSARSASRSSSPSPSAARRGRSARSSSSGSSVPFADADVELLAHDRRPHRRREPPRRARRRGARAPRATHGGRDAEGDARRAARSWSGAPSAPWPRCAARRDGRASAPPDRSAGHRAGRAAAARRRSTSPRRRSAGLRERARAIGLGDEAQLPDDVRRDPRRHALPGARDRARGERRRAWRRRSRGSRAT